MNGSRFQGDPAIHITQDGATMRFIGGQPVMDQGFENAALISLFTKPGYWGNTLCKKQSEKIGSEFEDQCNKPIQSITSLNDISDADTQALKWFEDNNIANNISIEVTNPKTDKLNVSIKIGTTELLMSKNASAWKAQANCPVHDKFPEDII